jgi:hypothetical protein
LSFSSLEEKVLEINLDKDKIKDLFAGPYIVNIKIKSDSISSDTSAILKFEEKSGIETTEIKEGWILRRYEIEKFNRGNMNTEVSVLIKKNIISALFTTLNVAPDRKEFNGLSVSYLYNREISPGESLRVVAKTNWWILLIILVVVLLILYFFNRYIKEKIVLSKRVSFVKTKGGEFALKVSIKVKARDYVERIRLIDRLPPMVKVFEGYGIAPGKVDERNRRLEWNIQALAKGEERTYSYIIYSKIGVMGRFELPRANVIYEFEGKLKDAASNDVFYSNEASMKKEE